MRYGDLRSVIIDEADPAFCKEAMSPISIQDNIGFRDLAVANKQPETEHCRGADVENGVSNDFGIDRGLPCTFGNTPDTDTVSLITSLTGMSLTSDMQSTRRV